MIVLNRRHLRRILKEYFEYYHEARTHLGLGKDSPITREVELFGAGAVVAEPMVGGLHHRYYRRLLEGASGYDQTCAEGLVHASSPAKGLFPHSYP